MINRELQAPTPAFTLTETSLKRFHTRKYNFFLELVQLLLSSLRPAMSVEGCCTENLLLWPVSFDNHSTSSACIHWLILQNVTPQKMLHDQVFQKFVARSVQVLYHSVTVSLSKFLLLQNVLCMASTSALRQLHKLNETIDLVTAWTFQWHELPIFTKMYLQSIYLLFQVRR